MGTLNRQSDLAADPLIKKQRELVAEHIASESEGRWEDTYKTFVDGDQSYFEAIPLNQRFEGQAGIRGFYASLAAGFPDLRITTLREGDVPGISYREVRIEGTHLGEFAGIPGSGRRVAVNLIAVFTFGTGEQVDKLIGETAYWDLNLMLAQIQGPLTPDRVIAVKTDIIRKNPERTGVEIRPA